MIADLLTFHDDRMKEPYLTELERRMIAAPDSLLILASIESDEVKAFLVAQNPGPEIPYMILTQVWSDPHNDRSWSDPFLARLVLWSLAHDKSYVRAETRRNAEAMYRRFGFEPSSTIVSLDLTPYSEEFLQWAVSLNQTSPKNPVFLDTSS